MPLLRWRTNLTPKNNGVKAGGQATISGGKLESRQIAHKAPPTVIRVTK